MTYACVSPNHICGSYVRTYGTWITISLFLLWKYRDTSLEKLIYVTLATYYKDAHTSVLPYRMYGWILWKCRDTILVRYRIRMSRFFYFIFLFLPIASLVPISSDSQRCMYTSDITSIAYENTWIYYYCNFLYGTVPYGKFLLV